LHAILLGVRFPFLIVPLALLPVCLSAQAPPQPPLVKILATEMERNFAALRSKADPAPYFLAYAVTQQETHLLAATGGMLASKDGSKTRTLDVTLRVGSPQLDNYHRVSGNAPSFTNGSLLSLDDNPNALKRRLWMDTDAVYRSASQRLLNIRTNKEVKVAATDQSGDFSPAPPVLSFKPVNELQFDADKWASRARHWSKRFQEYPEILNSSVAVLAQHEVKTFVNTEGTRLQHGRTFARILISARSKAADGMDLATSETLEADDPNRLPSDKAVEAAVDRVANDLRGLLRAPEVDPFVGPAILSGRAAGVFFHEIFGHRIEGHRQKDDTEGQTFTKSINAPVLPPFLSVTFDPTVRRIAETDLYGWYDFDDEGVVARRVPIVEAGVLKTFLLSRSPVAGFAQSNGHGRRQAGAEIVSRQSNLIVTSENSVPAGQLRELLIAEIRKQQKPYGLYFESVTGGFTTTGRAGLQAFTVIPLVVYRVYPDGRPDELVRGADIVGTPLASFAKIIATGNQPQVFNGYCGAESGSVPVSAISPALLVSEIEVQRKSRSQERPPLLGRPNPAAGGDR
jgi:TldD protein